MYVEDCPAGRGRTDLRNRIDSHYACRSRMNAQVLHDPLSSLRGTIGRMPGRAMGPKAMGAAASVDPGIEGCPVAEKSNSE